MNLSTLLRRSSFARVETTRVREASYIRTARCPFLLLFSSSYYVLQMLVIPFCRNCPLPLFVSASPPPSSSRGRKEGRRERGRSTPACFATKDRQRGRKKSVVVGRARFSFSTYGKQWEVCRPQRSRGARSRLHGFLRSLRASATCTKRKEQIEQGRSYSYFLSTLPPYIVIIRVVCGVYTDHATIYYFRRERIDT